MCTSTWPMGMPCACVQFIGYNKLKQTGNGGEKFVPNLDGMSPYVCPQSGECFFGNQTYMHRRQDQCNEHSPPLHSSVQLYTVRTQSSASVCMAVVWGAIVLLAQHGLPLQTVHIQNPYQRSSPVVSQCKCPMTQLETKPANKLTTRELPYKISSHLRLI